MFLNLKHGKFELWRDDLEIHFKVPRMDESFRKKNFVSEIPKFIATNGVNIISADYPEIYIGNNECRIWLHGLEKESDYNEVMITILIETERDKLFHMIINALEEWNNWMDTQNPISDVQKENILNYHSRMITIKGEK